MDPDEEEYSRVKGSYTCPCCGQEEERYEPYVTCDKCNGHRCSECREICDWCGGEICAAPQHQDENGDGVWCNEECHTKWVAAWDKRMADADAAIVAARNAGVPS